MFIIHFKVNFLNKILYSYKEILKKTCKNLQIFFTENLYFNNVKSTGYFRVLKLIK